MVVRNRGEMMKKQVEAIYSSDITCPECGRKAELCRKYTNGDRSYIHSRRLVQGPFPHWDVTDSCYVKKADLKKKKVQARVFDQGKRR